MFEFTPKLQAWVHKQLKVLRIMNYTSIKL